MEPQPTRRYSRPKNRSFEAYKAWIENMTVALGGRLTATDAEYEASWRRFWDGADEREADKTSAED